ncbi:MAG: hypothetical protein EP329_24125 [Deltaproteobacteria bacterium]|nr:MAG: hypothetical protein EP329_24125 [Deltaproteobacteria bacterium]
MKVLAWLGLCAVLIAGCGGTDPYLPAPPPAPVDTDGDGVVDTEDACPTVAGVGLTGCPRAATARTRGLATKPQRCDRDADCPAGQRCVEDCSAASGRSLGPWLAQPASCPSVCKADPAEDDEERQELEAEDEGEDEGEGDFKTRLAKRMKEPPRPWTPQPRPEPSEPSTPAPTTDTALLFPYETVAKGDGKVVRALEDAVAVQDEANAAIAAASGCESRARALERWGRANAARASRVNHRVEHLTARLIYDYTPEEKGLIARHEQAYERMNELLLAVCAEDGPELERLGTLDLDLRHTFHRSKPREPMDDVKCGQLQELRDRAMMAPETLFGERQRDGSYLTTVELPAFACFVNAGPWRDARPPSSSSPASTSGGAAISS